MKRHHNKLQAFFWPLYEMVVGHMGPTPKQTALRRRTRTPQELVDATFPSRGKPADLEYSDELLSQLRESWRELNSSIGKTVLAALAQAALFELLARAAIAKAALGPFEIKDLSLIRMAIPVLLAFSFYELQLLTSLQRNTQSAYMALMGRLHPKIVTLGLVSLIQPRPTSLFTPWTLELDKRAGAGKLYNRLGVILAMLLLLGIPIFEVYAFVLQAQYLGTRSLSFWLSLLLTAFFLLLGFLVLGAYLANKTNPRDDDRDGGPQR